MKLIVLDPGHGGSDPGAVNGSFQEKQFNLEIAVKARDYLQTYYQVNILMTRTTDTTVSLEKRVSLAHSHDADYFCSVHINAGGGTGWESYIYNGTVPSETVQAQTVIHNHVMSVIGSKYGVKDRGKKRANFYVLRETNMSAILLENLFIDNNHDLKLLRNSTFIQDLAHAIGEGLAKALALPSKTLYKVIAGSFKDRLNAENRKDYLKSKGIEAFIVTATISGKIWYRVQAGAFQHRSNAEARVEELKKAGISDAYILVE